MSKHFTRGDGILEGYLAKLRANKAKNLLVGINRNRILDIGCGYYPFFLHQINFKEKHGIDPSVNKKIVDDKKINLHKVDITKSSPFKDEYFNAVTMLAVFEHVDDSKLPDVLSDVNRILKKGGRFVVTTPAPWADRLLHTMARSHLISSEEIHEHKHHHSMNKIKKMIIGAGFKESNVKSGFFELGMNMWFVAKK